MRLLPFICLCFFLSSTAQASVVRTPLLIQAVQGGHMPLIGQLINGGAQVNAIDAWGRTAAHYAVSNNNLQALKFLLSSGAEANLTNNDGNTPFDLWHKHKHKKILELLHAAGARTSPTEAEEQQSVISSAIDTTPSSTELSSEDKVERQDLWQAAANNDRASAERLLAAGADAKAQNDAGKVPFDIAVEAEHCALAAILAKAAGGINGRDKKGWTPLHWAIVGDAWDLVREFIREGADLARGRGQYPFDVATLMESEAKLFEVFIAEKGVDGIVGKFGEKGVDARVGRNGETMLMLAARKMHTELVKLLIDNGADLNIKGGSNYGYTALMYAVKEGNTEIAKLLLDNGADLNIKDSFGYTALMFAVREGNTEIVKLLLDNKADISGEINYQKEVMYPADYKNNELMSAAEKGYTEIVELLIDNGADPNIKNMYGDTALMSAVEKGYTEIVELLIDNGADLNTRSKSGKTALDIAEQKGLQDIINILRAAQQRSM